MNLKSQREKKLPFLQKKNPIHQDKSWSPPNRLRSHVQFSLFTHLVNVANKVANDFAATLFHHLIYDIITLYNVRTYSFTSLI